jgi:PhnB protein
MPHIIPNFHFYGQCEQAIELYKNAFDAEVNVFMRYSDADPQDWRPGDGDSQVLAYVYHAEIVIGGQRLILSDSTGDDAPRGNSLSLVVAFETPDAVKAAYDIISEGANIVAPMKSTTYSSCFVSLIDKFGMRWELMN